MIDKLSHERIDIRIVGGSGQHQLAVLEGSRYGLRHIASGKIKDRYLRASLLLKLLHQQLHSLFGMTVYRGVGYHNSFGFRLVGGPGVIEGNIMPKVLGKHRTMKGADDLNIERGCHFQQVLHLSAVLSDDTDEISPGLIVPGLCHIVGTEFAEAICRKQDFIRTVIGNHNLRPMYHWSKYKGQKMSAQRKGSAIVNAKTLCFRGKVKELIHHHEGLLVCYDGGLRISLHEILDIRGMIRLHMLYHQIVRLSAAQHICHIVQPFMGKMDIHCIHHRDLLIQDDVGIVSHAVRHHVLPLKQIYLMIIDPDIPDIIGYLHCLFLLF